MNSQKNNKCFCCGGTRVLWLGGKSHCADCFEAGAQSVNTLWEAVNKHIDDEVKKNDTK